MNVSSEQRLSRLVNAGNSRLLVGGLKGVEKESLRVTPDGWISRDPHPASLGSALTHPSITTDFSEALLEFITPPFVNAADAIKHLCDIHRFVYNKLQGELLWATSMPCLVGDDKSIPIADYGSSNVGTMKRVYRQGLRHRYGSLMQTISGIHFNYSFPDAFWSAWREIEGDTRSRQTMVSDAYFRLVRNFQRYGWLLPYLFGASPAVCKTFLAGRAGGFDEFDDGTLFQPHATSLRMSDIGYKNRSQESLGISYRNLDEYVATLTRAIEAPYPEYDQIGVKVNGQYKQLNTNLLQIENEYYSFIRPKQIAESGEKPTLALKRRGVRYVEIRALDVGAFDPVGITEEQMHFMEAFMAFCLFQDSVPVSDEEGKQNEFNQSTVACCGRDPGLRISVLGVSKPIKQWVTWLCESMRGYCELLDDSRPARPYSSALERQLEIAADPSQMPSSRILSEMHANQEPFFVFAMRKSIEHQQYFYDHALDAAATREFEDLATRSITQQQQIEAGDECSFEEYLQRYFAQK